jgi:hypothetical protein
LPEPGIHFALPDKLAGLFISLASLPNTHPEIQSGYSFFDGCSEAAPIKKRITLIFKWVQNIPTYIPTYGEDISPH